MSMPMNNLNQGGYNPYAQPFGGGYPNAPPIDQQPGGYQPPQPGAHQPPQPGFAPPGGYQPVPQYPPPGSGGQPGPFPPHAGGGSYPPGPGMQQPGPGMQQPGQYPPPGPYAPPGFQGSPGQQPPIVTQPGAGQDGWMNMPTGVPNCPPGLEYLTTIDQLLVKQKVELLEALTGFETNNKFTIKNSLGQKVYWGIEENDCCTRNMCGPARPFDMKILDIYKNQVMHMHRPLACSSCFFPCCLQSMEVSAPPGNVVGTIEQEWSICTPQFTIRNHLGDPVIRIEGPFCTFTMCGDVEFKVMSLTGEQIGKISKQWSGLVREMFTDADFFGISFPMDLDVRMKAVLLGACFLIDAMFFEKQANRETDRPGMF